jgi:CRISPR/Cas system-associated protein endoribonuclease Cas2
VATNYTTRAISLTKDSLAFKYKIFQLNSHSDNKLFVTLLTIAKSVTNTVFLLYNIGMSIALDILKEMYKKELNYKGYRCNILGLPISFVRNRNSLRVIINRLKRNDYISNEDEKWIITELGMKYVEDKIHSFEQFDSPFTKDSKKNLLLTFDIPEVKRAERDWFRWHLKKFEYILVQKSVWVGPSPLPKDFARYLKEINLSKCIKTFKLSKSHTQ